MSPEKRRAIASEGGLKRLIRKAVLFPGPTARVQGWSQRRTDLERESELKSLKRHSVSENFNDPEMSATIPSTFGDRAGVGGYTARLAKTPPERGS